MTQSQAQARRPGGAANSRPTSVRLSQRARRHAGNIPTWSGREDHSTILTTGPITAQLSRQVTLHSNASTLTRNQESIKLAGHIQPLKTDKHQKSGARTDKTKICSLEFFESTTLQSLPRGSASRSCLSKPPWLSSDFFNPSLPLVASPFPRHSLPHRQHLPAFGR